jgi:hypothetical protein
MTSSDLLVLHTLRCVGFVGLAHVAEAAGLCESDVESELIDLAVVGLVTRVAGEFGGWGLTEVGRVVDGERIADELVAIGARPVVMEAYEEFVVLNPELLDLCAAWQIRSVRFSPPRRNCLRTAVRDHAPVRAIPGTAHPRTHPSQGRFTCPRHRQYPVVPHHLVPAPRRPAHHARHPPGALTDDPPALS